jgi:hypothetical protein
MFESLIMSIAVVRLAAEAAAGWRKNADLATEDQRKYRKS